MRACWLKWVGRDWSISADYIWLNYSGANNRASVKGHDGIFYTFDNQFGISGFCNSQRLNSLFACGVLI